MPQSFGIPELLIILGIIVLLFGVGRISKIAGELGSGIRAFKQGLNDGDDKDKKTESEPGTEPEASAKAEAEKKE